jgi:hypothetical protein
MPSRLVLLCVASLAGCGGANAAPPDERPHVEAGTAGVTLVLPEGWQALVRDDGNIVDPVTRIAIASGPLRDPVPDCETQITRYAPRRDGVSVVVLEWSEPSNGELPLRPTIFDQQALPLRRGEIVCFQGDGGAVQFETRNRTFGAYLLVGEQADAELVAEARRALDTLRIERPSG